MCEDVQLIQTSGDDAHVQCVKCRKIIGKVKTLARFAQGREAAEAQIQVDVDRLARTHESGCPGTPGDPPPDAERFIRL